METLLKQLVKEAVLEALVEFSNGGVATVEIVDNLGQAPSQGQENNGGNTGGNNTGSGEDESGKGGASEESSGGGVGPGGKPKPDVGVGAFGLR